MHPLPFPSVVVASTDDPYANFAFASTCAEAWSSGLVNVGAKGHINSESGLGTWTEGLVLLRELAAD